jgi:TPP-dependent pyruvate/acetoin dehydrogenase alpha subunit
LQERDPVERVKKLMLAHGGDAAEIKAIEKKVKKEVDSAVEEAKVGGHIEEEHINASYTDGQHFVFLS